MRTNEEHVAAEGMSCPFCDSDETEGGFVETGGGQAQQEMYCHDCEESWIERYALTGWEPSNA